MIFQLLTLIVILILLILSVSKWKVHPFVALLLAAITLGLFLGLGGAQTVEVLLQGFSKTLKWIAIVVIVGAFIGEVLRETGGAIRISDKIVRWVGEKRLPWAMGFTGYLVSIPVFVDVAYIVLQPVTEALAARTKKPVLVIGLALTAGLTVSHTLIPPTPGPLAVASLLDADIGRLLLINGLVGLCAMAGGILWASRYCKDFRLPYDDKLASLSNQHTDPTNKDKRSSSVLMDLLPILIPIILMGVGTIFDKDTPGFLAQSFLFLSTPMIAVMIGAAIAWIQFSRQETEKKVNQLVEQAIVTSALVIMITGAGGAFGAVIRESGLQNSLAEFFVGLPFLSFLLPFMVAAVLTTSTGSITVSLIGTASIFGPMAGDMPYSPELMAALIGSGSFCVFHANSSFFWLLNRLHDVPVNVLYRTYTPQSFVMGLSGLLGVLILWAIGIG
ncbi:MAG: GntP family permease [Bacteroidota bacterium]